MGYIIDESSGKLLPGAGALLEGTNLGAASLRDGSYVISNVPAGTYKLIISYVGYENFETEVTVAEGAVVQQDASLISAVIKLDEVTYSLLRQGQARALSLQRSSERIVNVVSEDLIDAFPDNNAAEAIQRLPGITLERDQGEGRYIVVRGTESRLNSMMINGQRIPSPEGDQRNPVLDVIPSDLLGSIEVSKALTPDMDGDAIGGAVDLITKDAFDYDQRIIEFDAGGGYRNIRGTGSYHSSFSYIDKFLDGKLGVTIGASTNFTRQGTDNVEMEWADAYEYVTDVVDDFEVDEDDPSDTTFFYVIDETDGWTLADFEQRYYRVDRTRNGVNANFDYRLDANNRFFLRTLYNHYDDIEHRDRIRYQVDKSVDEEEPGSGYQSATSVVGSRAVRELKYREETQMIQSYALGGVHSFPWFDMDYQAVFSLADEEEPFSRYYAFQAKDIDYTFTLDKNFPKFTVDAGDINDLSAYEFDEAANQDGRWTKDHDKTYLVNMKFPYSFSKTSGNLKVGAKYSHKNKEMKNHRYEYSWEGDDDLVMTDFAKDLDYTDFMGGEYEYHHLIDEDLIQEYMDSHSADFEMTENLEDKYFDSFDAIEEIKAGYGMATINFGKFMFLPGVRVEQTLTSYFGWDGNLDDPASFRKIWGGENTYTSVLPMVHLRYKFDNRTILRLAYTNSLARPNYHDLAPYRTTIEDEQQVGNPKLEPTSATNIDLMGEYYVGSLGLISAGYFIKTLDSYIYPQVTEYDDPADGIEKRFMPVNGEAADLSGFEIAWQQQLNFLPGALSGLGVYFNYTNTSSEAKYPNRDVTTTLPGQAQHVLNAALSYEKSRFSGRVSVNFHGKYLFEVGESVDEDVYKDNRMQVDFSSRYALSKNLSLYANGINLTNAPLRHYVGIEDHEVQREHYSFALSAGLKYKF
ncbi:MAG: TonB-dependent receptor [bacterium]